METTLASASFGRVTSWHVCFSCPAVTVRFIETTISCVNPGDPASAPPGTSRLAVDDEQPSSARKRAESRMLMEGQRVALARAGVDRVCYNPERPGGACPSMV